MKETIDQKNKIIKSFCVIGLNPDQLNNYYDDEKPNSYVQNIDLLVKKMPTTKNILTFGKEKEEKWYRVMKDSDTWLRVKYTKRYDNPITDFKIMGCKYDDSENYLLIDKKYIKDNNYYPIRVTKINDNNEDNEEIKILGEYKPMFLENDICDNNFVKFSKEFNVKEIMNLSVKNKAGVILVSRDYNNLPLKYIKIQYLDDNNYQFQKSIYKSGFSKIYNPEVLDQYPPVDSYNNSIAMFCFPEGINIREEKDTPKKFNFVLTDEVGERTFASALIFWEKLNDDIRKSIVPIYNEQIEKTQEEIENEKKENEEKGEKDKEIKPFKLKNYYIPKAICILSRFPFFSNNILFLKELYKIFNSSSTNILLERAICGYVDSLYKQSYNQLIRFTIRKQIIDFYFIPNYGKEWDINDQYLETLFRVLSIDIISTAWQGLLLEKQLFLLCSSKETLLQVAHSFITLLFPFKWIHTYIPILPQKLKAFVESPMPLIFGIPFKIDVNELPEDSLIINIEKNCFENYRQEIPKLTGKLKVVLDKKLKNLKDKYQIENPIDANIWMEYLEEVEPQKIPENINKIDCGEIRDVFFDVFIHMFKNCSKYFNSDKNKNKDIDKDKDKENKNEQEEDEEEEEEPIEFKRETFLRDNGSTGEESFLSLFCDTALFSQFISSISIKHRDSSTAFFFECIKNGKGKNQVFLPNIIPKEIILAPSIIIDNINQEYYHFPKLDPKYYIKYEAPLRPYKSKFIFQKDEWCYNPLKLKKKEWPNYFLYLVYEIWYNFFSFSVHFYEKEKSKELMNYAIFLLQDLIQKKIVPTRNLFSKLFKACGRNQLSSYTKTVLSLVNNVYKKSSSILFQNAYLNGYYALTGNINSNSNNSINISLTHSIFNVTNIKNIIINNKKSQNIDFYKNIDDYIFLTEIYCPFCTTNIQKIKFISMEELLAGFNKDINKKDSICPFCLNAITPYIYYLNMKEKKIDIQKFELLTPYKIINEIDEINKNFGEYYFYLNNKDNYNKMDDIYKSIIFYFKLFDLPLFVLSIENDEGKFEENILKEINENFTRKNNAQRKGAKERISPDKRTKQHIDTSEDNKSLDSFSNITGKSSNNLGTSFLGKELWKDIILQNKDKITLTGDKIGVGNKNVLSNRIKYMKSVLTDITSYFVSYYKEKLETFLNENGFYNEIKEKDSLSIINTTNTNTNISNIDNNEKDSQIIDEKKNTIKKTRPQSYDKKRYEGLSSDNYNKKKNINDNNNLINYESNAFDAIIKENREGLENSTDRKKGEIPQGFNYINQLNDPNDMRAKGFGSSIKRFFSFKKKTKNNNVNKFRESK